jgi:PAS domain S-box-containing protein
MSNAINSPKSATRMAEWQEQSLPPPRLAGEKAVALALRLAHAENALDTLTSGQVDAIVAPNGKTYLLHGAQEELRQSKRGLQTLFDSASDLITVINRGGQIVAQSRAVVRMLGFQPEDFVAKSFFDFIHSDDVPRVRLVFFSVIDGFRDDAIMEFRHLTADGSFRILEASVSKLRDVTVSRVVLICRDVKRRRQAQEAEDRRQKAIQAEALDNAL